ncbi:lysophospholipid acyltransferase family protein, partial [Megasphaera sp.]|uniref:lysophospholipid acyltransferase family protein n=1 Tax=Megasphaera sp. TaxID=2023260 RepID=UPI0040276044
MHTFTYGVIRKIFNVATYGVLGMEVIGEENIPEKGPFLVVCNHASNFDPPLLGTAMRHHLIHFMAKEELFRNPLMGWFLRYVHTFPVHRGHIDRKAGIESFRVLKSG